MIELLSKFTFLIVSGIILWQDVKERAVFWFLYPFLFICALGVQLTYTQIYLLGINILINTIFVSVIIGTVWLYYKISGKGKIINTAIGTGDIVLFYCLTATFPPISFLIMFVFSLLFSLVLHLLIKKKLKEETVPLAGYICLFFSGIYTITFFIRYNTLFLF